MRPLKCRVWDVTGDCGMIYPHEISWCMGDDGIERVYFSAETVHGVVHSGFGASDGSEDFSSIWELMWYSGLKDKNDKWIYDDDIVKFNQCSGGDYDKHGLIGFIKYNEGCFQIWDINKNEYLSDLISPVLNKEIEIIGNIHQNIELIK